MNLYSLAFQAVAPLWETVQINRRPQTIVNTGRGAIGPIMTYTAQAVVVAKTPDDLERGPDYQIMQRTIQVDTSFALQGPASGFQPDEVIWHGTTFIVTSIEDFSKFGVGFVSAICRSVIATDVPPMLS